MNLDSRIDYLPKFPDHQPGRTVWVNELEPEEDTQMDSNTKLICGECGEELATGDFNKEFNHLTIETCACQKDVVEELEKEINKLEEDRDMTEVDFLVLQDEFDDQRKELEDAEGKIADLEAEVSSLKDALKDETAF